MRGSGALFSEDLELLPAAAAADMSLTGSNSSLNSCLLSLLLGTLPSSRRELCILSLLRKDVAT